MTFNLNSTSAIHNHFDFCLVSVVQETKSLALKSMICFNKPNLSASLRTNADVHILIHKNLKDTFIFSRYVWCCLAMGHYEVY